MLTRGHIFQTLRFVTCLLDDLQFGTHQIKEQQQDGHGCQSEQIVLDALDKRFISHLLNLCRDRLQLEEFTIHSLHPEFQTRESLSGRLGLGVIGLDIGKEGLFLGLHLLQTTCQFRRERELSCLFV